MIANQLRSVSGQQAIGLTLSSAATKARVPRYPKHPFNITQKPYEITPFFIAPVLAGETMKNLLLQCRTVSSPLKNRLIGHHLEHYFFYVRLRDLDDAKDIVKALMDPNASSGIDQTIGGVPEYYSVSGPSYVKQCLQAITRHWFRDEGETTLNGTTGRIQSINEFPTGGYPLAQWTNFKSFFESLTSDTDMLTNLPNEPTEGDIAEWDKEYQTWQFMRQMQLTEVSFEDYLGSFGVKTSNEALNKPELVRMVKNWTYPTNTVDAEGNINTQTSWSVQERADKDRFFKEPGFLFGVSIARPKLYISQQDQSAISLLGDAFAWLPAMMKDTPVSSLKKLIGGDKHNPLASAEEPDPGEIADDDAMWFDVRDLFLYGDQFTNRTLDENINAVPASEILNFHGKKYPARASLQELGMNDVLTYESDGVVSLNILGTQIDAT